MPCEPAPPHRHSSVCAQPPRSPTPSHPQLHRVGGYTCKAIVGDSNPRAAQDPANNFHEARPPNADIIRRAADPRERLGSGGCRRAAVNRHPPAAQANRPAQTWPSLRSPLHSG